MSEEMMGSDDLMLAVLTGGAIIRMRDVSKMIQAAAMWCGVSVAKFVVDAILEHLADVQAAMDEEQAWEV